MNTSAPVYLGTAVGAPPTSAPVDLGTAVGAPPGSDPPGFFGPASSAFSRRPGASSSGLLPRPEPVSNPQFTAADFDETGYSMNFLSFQRVFPYLQTLVPTAQPPPRPVTQKKVKEDEEEEEEGNASTKGPKGKKGQSKKGKEEEDEEEEEEGKASPRGKKGKKFKAIKNISELPNDGGFENVIKSVKEGLAPDASQRAKINEAAVKLWNENLGQFDDLSAVETVLAAARDAT